MQTQARRPHRQRHLLLLLLPLLVPHCCLLSNQPLLFQVGSLQLLVLVLVSTPPLPLYVPLPLFSNHSTNE